MLARTIPVSRRLPDSLTDHRYPTQNKTLGERLRKARLDLGLTMVELADQLGVSESSIRAWERGYYRPGRDALQRIKRFWRGRGRGEELGRRELTSPLDPSVR